MSRKMGSLTIGKALQQARIKLQIEGVSDWRLDAEWMLAHVTGKKRVELLLHSQDLLSLDEKIMIHQLVEERCKGKPLQYLLGFQEFMGLDFLVDERVLIPRQDTETLVEEAIRILKERWGGKAHILDIGTGSGAIAVSIAKALSDCRIAAVDIEKSALQVAQKNAKNHRVEDRIQFYYGDFFDALPQSGFEVDLIVSNPPYIPSGVIQGLQREVKDHEPLRALDGGEDGLDCYRRISEQAPSFLCPGGMILLEVGHDQAQRVKEILSEHFEDRYSVKDLTGIDRVVGASVMKDKKPRE